MTPDEDIRSFLAELNSEFGKKPKSKEPPHKALNRAFHEANPQVPRASGKAPERLNPEDSSHWKPEARVTHIVHQRCKCCGNTASFIGGEYVRYRSIMRFGGTILRRTENCSNDWHFPDLEQPLSDVYEEHMQEVARCVGCIQVERQAEEIWLAALEQQRQSMKQLPLIDITKPLPQARKPHADDGDIEVRFE